MKIGVILGSTRPGRNGEAVAKWFMSQADKYESDTEFELVDLAKWDLPVFNEPGFPASGEYANEKTKEWSQEIAQYDGFIYLVTEYNRGMPAAIKNAIDYLYHEWSFKPVGFVGYSSAGAFRTISQLRDVVGELNMVGIRKQIAINVWEAVADGKWAAGDKHDKEVEGLLGQLEWWARLLKPARESGDLPH